ncbi:MAG: hypothetical protein ACHREM_11625 [Polyangiales bacterium]
MIILAAALGTMAVVANHVYENQEASWKVPILRGLAPFAVVGLLALVRLLVLRALRDGAIARAQLLLNWLDEVNPGPKPRTLGAQASWVAMSDDDIREGQAARPRATGSTHLLLNLGEHIERASTETVAVALCTGVGLEVVSLLVTCDVSEFFRAVAVGVLLPVLIYLLVTFTWWILRRRRRQQLLRELRQELARLAAETAAVGPSATPSAPIVDAQKAVSGVFFRIANLNDPKADIDAAFMEEEAIRCSAPGAR